MDIVIEADDGREYINPRLAGTAGGRPFRGAFSTHPVSGLMLHVVFDVTRSEAASPSVIGKLSSDLVLHSGLPCQIHSTNGVAINKGSFIQINARLSGRVPVSMIVDPQPNSGQPGKNFSGVTCKKCEESDYSAEQLDGLIGELRADGEFPSVQEIAPTEIATGQLADPLRILRAYHQADKALLAYVELIDMLRAGLPPGRDFSIPAREVIERLQDALIEIKQAIAEGVFGQE